MLPPGLAERLCRLSVLQPERIEMIHPLTPAHRIIGWSILPDEHWTNGDGPQLVRAVEAAAQLDFEEILKRYRMTGNL